MSEPTLTGPELITEDSKPTVVRKHPLAICEECSLYQEGRYAGGHGPDQADIVVLGEAPGYQEAKEGRPFTGPSGKLLDTVLSNFNINRSETYVDNIVACRPPDNRTPTKSEVECCYPRARAEVQQRSPRQIICLGNTAAQAVMETSVGITQLRVGPPKQSDQFPGVEIIPTFHPAACLRAPDFFPHLVTDIGKTQPHINIKWEPPQFKVFTDIREALRAVNELHMLDKPLVIDIEVGVEKDFASAHSEQFDMLCIGISYAPGKAVVFSEEVCQSVLFVQQFKQLLKHTDWICHNGKFDLAGLYGYTGAMGRLHFDTMLASYVLDERPGVHGLKYLATELLGAPDYGAMVARYVGKNDSYAIVPRDVLYEYNAYDVACTYLLYEKYRQEFDDEQWKLHNFLVEISNQIIWAEMEGIKIDQAYSESLVDSYLQELEGLEGQLRPWVENPRSPLQVKAALHKMGFRVVSTDVDNLNAILTKCSPDSETAQFVRLMLQQRREQKLYGTYVKGIRKRLYKGRIYSTFLLHGTTTGRPASRNPNLFNIPRESSIRRQFVPEEGNVFVQADYATIELRTMAVESEDSFLASIFREGRDLHNEFSLAFYGPDFTKDQRVRTKAFVFGSAYGREPYSIAMEYGIPIKEAEANQNKFFAMMPGVMAWREGIYDTIFKDHDDLVTRFGRHRRFWLITDANKKDVYKEGLAFIPQSTAADICAHAYIKLRRDHHLHTRVSVYDSILVECPASDADDVARCMVTTMEETAAELMGDFVPFPVDVRIGTNWGEV